MSSDDGGEPHQHQPVSGEWQGVCQGACLGCVCGCVLDVFEDVSGLYLRVAMSGSYT